MTRLRRRAGHLAGAAFIAVGAQLAAALLVLSILATR